MKIVEKARQRVPKATLCLLVVGLDAYAKQCERQGWAQGPVIVRDALVQLTVTNPGVRGTGSP